MLGQSLGLFTEFNLQSERTPLGRTMVHVFDLSWFIADTILFLQIHHKQAGGRACVSGCKAR